MRGLRGTTAAVVAVIAICLYPIRIVRSAESYPAYEPIVIGAEYEREYLEVINNTVEYVFLYNATNVTLLEAARIQVESNATEDDPLIVVVRQKKGILSWEIPLLVDSVYFNTLSYNKTSRTLCSIKYYRDAPERDETEFVTVTISTASYKNVVFKLNVSEVTNFHLLTGESRVVEVSPAEPIYLGYKFTGEMDTSSVIVHVESNNDICMTVSIQNATCPVFDLERNIEFSGRWQTVSRQGGITASREVYPSGFFVVLVVKGDDTDCVGTPSANSMRNKIVTLTVRTSIAQQDYIFASMLTIGSILGFCVVYVVGVFIWKIKNGRKLRNERLDSRDTEDVPSPSTVEEMGPKQWTSIEEDSSLDEDDIDLMEDALSDKEVVRTKLVLSVCDLARKDPKILRHKSRLYLYYLGTVAIFYTLPVLQLATTYVHVYHDTGNEDMCYYNFLCARPLGLLNDFNHVFSNIGYVMLGLLFIFLTYTRENNESEEKNKCYGIPQHFGLFYAMGTALIMEGILSACYHVCPNQSNFQFDTSFMYIIAVLCMIKIYQTRHPDINARAPVTFGVLALLILIGLIGVLNGSRYFWVVFTIIHLLVCLSLTIQIYYMGRFKFNRGLCSRIAQMIRYEARNGILALCKPLYGGRFVMLVVANLCNVVLAVLGNIYHAKNFATFLLAILMSNLILYTLFYIVMKLCHKERILVKSWIYITLAFLFWGGALYFFINKTISWAVTPAQSRLHNKPCKLFNFYDSHDIWHFLSALAMFFSFMVLLTLDDDLDDVHRSQIPVF